MWIISKKKIKKGKRKIIIRKITVDRKRKKIQNTQRNIIRKEKEEKEMKTTDEDKYEK